MLHLSTSVLYLKCHAGVLKNAGVCNTTVTRSCKNKFKQFKDQAQFFSGQDFNCVWYVGSGVLTLTSAPLEEGCLYFQAPVRSIRLYLSSSMHSSWSIIQYLSLYSNGSWLSIPALALISPKFLDAFKLVNHSIS